MSENVIEQLTKELYTTATMNGEDVAEGLILAAEKLQSATRPEQFMPPLEDWPEDATTIQLTHDNNNHGAVFRSWEGDDWICVFEFIDADEKIVQYKGAIAFPVSIPLGIDPRIKVSLAQMEAYENG